MSEYGKDYTKYEVEIHGTGYPMDGHKAVVSLWAYDPSCYHLDGWEKEDDAVFGESMYNSEVDAGICAWDTLEEFEQARQDGAWEPCGVFALEPDQVTILREYPGKMNT